MRYMGVEIDRENKRLVWSPDRLQENVFVVIAMIQDHLRIKLRGSPYEIEDGKFAWDYIER